MRKDDRVLSAALPIWGLVEPGCLGAEFLVGEPPVDTSLEDDSFTKKPRLV